MDDKRPEFDAVPIEVLQDLKRAVKRVEAEKEARGLLPRPRKALAEKKEGTQVIKVSETDQAILDNLALLGGQRPTEDSVVFEGSRFTLPEYLNGDVGAAVEYLTGWQREQGTAQVFTRDFPFHPWDVAAATSRVMSKVFGAAALTVKSPFGPSHETRTIYISATDTIQVPLGKVAVPLLGGELVIDSTRNREGQMVGQLALSIPKKYSSQAQGFFNAVLIELQEFSIYRGKAFDGNWADPAFLDLARFNPNKVAYSEEVVRQLSANVFSVLRHTQSLRDNGLPIRRSVLLFGPYGTGKTTAAMMTALECIQNGWTFILVRPGQDLQTALNTAKLYSPAVVFYEDVDTITESGESDHVANLLDMFDGMVSKTSDVMVMMTTNHAERIHKGMLRPGRLDAVIEIGPLDDEGIRKLVLATSNGLLADDIDFIAVAESMREYLPAFVVEATHRAIRYAIDRTGGHPEKIGTDDLVQAAQGLRPQFTMMVEATEGKKRPELEDMLYDIFTDASTDALQAHAPGIVGSAVASVGPEATVSGIRQAVKRGTRSRDEVQDVVREGVEGML